MFLVEFKSEHKQELNNYALVKGLFLSVMK